MWRLSHGDIVHGYLPRNIAFCGLQHCLSTCKTIFGNYIQQESLWWRIIFQVVSCRENRYRVEFTHRFFPAFAAISTPEDYQFCAMPESLILEQINI